MGATDDEKLEIVPRLTTGLLPFEWKNLGAAFGISDKTGPSASGRCRFVVRRGTDPVGDATTAVEGLADVGVALKQGTLAIGITAGNLSFRSGLDDPTAAVAQRVGEESVPSLKLSAAKQFDGDNYVAVSYDLKQQKPELSACWTGSVRNDRATLLVKMDPVQRGVKLAAAVSTPGPEWRKVLYNDETDMLEYPQDDGARHTLYVQHDVRGRDLLHRTRVGCRLDLGRIVNYVLDFMDYYVEERIPNLVWSVPGTSLLWNVLVPADNDEQVRVPLKDWSLDVSQDFAKGPKPALALSKKLGGLGTVSASYDMADEEAGVALSRSGVTVAARMGRAGDRGWSKPCIHVFVEPLSLLG